MNNPRSTDIFRVLFVCSGNICRSPTAEGVFTARAVARGLAGHVKADSAGTGGWHVGEAPDPRSQDCARARGVEIGHQRARQVAADDFTRFDMILAMDSGHLAKLMRAAPKGAEDRIHLFLDFAPEHGTRDVPDPYYGGGDGFERVFDMIEQAAEGLLDHIEAEHVAAR
jgi:protein-tyrosine phosphatase